MSWLTLRNRKLVSALALFGAILLIGLVIWRAQGPVYVQVAATVKDLPFEVETIPAAVWARPGDVISVTYRIRNTDIIPLEALGRVDVEPKSAADQVKIYLTQCSGLNAFQATFPTDYQVVFRVQPAGLFGSSLVTIRHTFTRANSR